MAVADFELVGRQTELARLEQLIDELDHACGALVLRGDPGIGKTVLWRAATEAARQAGARVLSTRCAEAEMPLTLGGLADLLEGTFPELAQELPEPQRRLLATTLGAESPARSPDQTALPRAFLAYLRTVAAEGPVLVAIDDAQWLDPPSRKVVAFATRRLRDAGVGILTTQRGETSDPLELQRAFDERFAEIQVGPLSVGALHHLIRKRLGVRLPRPTAARIHVASGGNPMFALEFAKESALARGPMPLPHSLDELVRGRVARVPPEVLGLLAAVAAAQRPTASLLEAVVADASALLDAAAVEGAVTLDPDGVVRFTHPLLASAAYAAVPPLARRGLHARLAAASGEPEQRARHLALATAEPDAEVARTLAEAASRARSRGAPDAAADLASHAVRLTSVAEADARAERVIEAATYESDAGRTARARALLEELLAVPVLGHLRARALLLVAALEEDSARIRQLSEEALSHAGDDAALRVRALVEMAGHSVEHGDLTAEELAQQALAIAEDLGDPATLALALTVLGYVRDIGGHAEPELLQRAIDLGAGHQPVKGAVRPGMSLALLRLWAGELAEARQLLEAEHDAAYTWGDERLTEVVRRLLVALEWWEGNWERAERRLEEHSEFVFDSEDRAAEVHGHWQQALLAASRGRVEEARERAHEAVRTGEKNQFHLFVTLGRWVLGFLDLSLDAPADAWQALRLVPLTDHPRHIWFLPDVVEAAIATGLLDEAESRLAALEAQTRARSHRWGAPAVLRCRALLLLARGDATAALRAAEQAAAGFESAGFPLDRGRALLAAGEALRRVGERRRAAEKLEAAHTIFAELGAPLWEARAAKELRRASPRPRRDGELTSGERRVAALVAAGRTNREVAAQLFTTVGTVEVHLTRIYRKLGVRSRTELAHRAAEGRLDLDGA